MSGQCEVRTWRDAMYQMSTVDPRWPSRRASTSRAAPRTRAGWLLSCPKPSGRRARTVISTDGVRSAALMPVSGGAAAERTRLSPSVILQISLAQSHLHHDCWPQNELTEGNCNALALSRVSGDHPSQRFPRASPFRRQLSLPHLSPGLGCRGYERRVEGCAPHRGYGTEALPEKADPRLTPDDTARAPVSASTVGRSGRCRDRVPAQVVDGQSPS